VSDMIEIQEHLEFAKVAKVGRLLDKCYLELICEWRYYAWSELRIKSECVYIQWHKIN